MTPVEFTVSALDEAAMLAFGAALAPVLKPPMVIYLQGDLGMGKTTLSRGLIQAMGHRGAVKSPTYTLVEPYRFGALSVNHFDLYRLGDSEELEFMGIRDYFTPDSLCLIEWPDRGFGVLPPADLKINIGAQGSGRCLHIVAMTSAGMAAVAQLQQSI